MHLLLGHMSAACPFIKLHVLTSICNLKKLTMHPNFPNSSLQVSLNPLLKISFSNYIFGTSKIEKTRFQWKIWIVNTNSASWCMMHLSPLSPLVTLWSHESWVFYFWQIQISWNKVGYSTQSLLLATENEWKNGWWCLPLELFISRHTGLCKFTAKIQWKAEDQQQTSTPQTHQKS